MKSCKLFNGSARLTVTGAVTEKCQLWTQSQSRNDSYVAPDVLDAVLPVVLDLGELPLLLGADLEGTLTRLVLVDHRCGLLRILLLRRKRGGRGLILRGRRRRGRLRRRGRGAGLRLTLTLTLASSAGHLILQPLDDGVGNLKWDTVLCETDLTLGMISGSTLMTPSASSLTTVNFLGLL